MPLAYIVTIGAMLCWAILSVTNRVLLLTFNFDPWTFSFIQLGAGGVALLVMSGKGGFNPASFMRPMTWILGGLRVVSASLYTAVLAWISVLEAGVLGTLNLPILVIAVWILTRKPPARVEWFGHLLILVAILFLAQSLEPEIRLPAIWLMGLNAVCFSVVALLSERHPDNISDMPGARMRFSGAVLLVTAAFFLIARLVQNGLGEGLGDGPGNGAVEMPLLVSGIVVGIFLRAPAIFLAFWSIRIAGALGYTGAVTLLPVFGMVFEQAALSVGLLEETRFRPQTLGLAVMVISGSLLVVMSRARMARRADEKPA